MNAEQVLFQHSSNESLYTQLKRTENAELMKKSTTINKQIEEEIDNCIEMTDNLAKTRLNRKVNQIFVLINLFFNFTQPITMTNDIRSLKYFNFFQ